MHRRNYILGQPSNCKRQMSSEMIIKIKTRARGNRIFLPKRVSVSSVSAIVEVWHACARMGRFIRTCNVCWRATWAYSSVLMFGNIFDLRIICNLGIISASLFGKFCDLLRFACVFFADPSLKFGHCISFNFGIIWLIFGKFCVSFHCVL